jgi:uncharacterized membrane protein YccC
MVLLDQAVAEGVSAHRHAILLAAITRVARIGLEVDRLTFTARENVQHELRPMVRPELQATVEAIAQVLDEIACELPTHIAVGVDKPPPASRARVRLAMDALTRRIVQVRPTYIGTASPAEVENLASFTNSLAALTGFVERLLDEPPQPPPAAAPNIARPRSTAADPAVVRFAAKVGLCTVIGYVIGITTQRVDLSTILTTVLITALPTYGASLRKMILRIIGAVLGGAVSLLAIIIVSPNFETLPAFLLAIFIVFYVSAYASLTSGRIAYAGKQIGTTFALVFTGLSPAVDIYEPLWRIWGILLGTVVVAIVFCIQWPEYAGDSLMPRLRKVLRETLALVPGGSAAGTEDATHQANSETMRVLAEILQVADDAQIEGRTSTIDHKAVVDAAGALRRIANRLASIATDRIATPMPQLDPATELARQAALDAIRRKLQSWLDFFSGEERLSASAAHRVALSHPPDEVAAPVAEFGSRLEAGEFALIESWGSEQRRAILAELQSMRRLEFLVSQLNRWFAQIPGPASSPNSRIAMAQAH